VNMNDLPISRLINVGVNLSPLAAQAQNLSTLLMLGTADVIGVTERIRTYSTAAAVATDFGTSSPEYACAALYFGQAPQPSQMMIGRWAQTAVAGRLICGTLSAAQQAIALWDAVTTPAFYLIMDGIPRAVIPASFAAATTLPGIAALIQTELQSIAAGWTCVWNAAYNRFEIKSGTTGVGSSVSFAQAPHAIGSLAFSVNPSNGNTITLNGTVVTFVSANPTGNQVLIGTNLAATLANAMTFFSGSYDPGITSFTYLLVGGTTIYCTAAVAGTAGNLLTLAASVATVVSPTGGSGTDISAMMAAVFSTTSGASAGSGVAAETALQAVTLLDSQFGQQWYALTCPAAVDTDDIAIAGFIEATNNKHLYGVTTQETGVLVPGDTGDLAAQLQALGYNKTCVQYSSSSNYAVCSLLGRILPVNYQANNSTITLMYKQEPGVAAEAVNATQIGALEAKNCNVFVAYNNNTAIIEPGVCSSGQFIDTITGIDWLAVTLMTAIYNLLYTTPTKIPQTDAGTHLIVTTCESVLTQAVANGLLAPGTWTAGGFGTLVQNGFLSKGFYVFAPAISTQTAAARAARQSVPIQIAAKLAGAIHTVNLLINVNQ
jgi:hypothetical protein